MHAHGPGVHDGGHDHHPSPLRRLASLLAGEKGDLWVLLVYAVITGLLALIMPLAVQGLVNTIAQGLYLQQVTVLALVVLGGLLVVGIFQLLQLCLVEVLQQRIFARTALTLSSHLPRVKTSALANEYAPEVVNRFFDVLTVQKTISKLLLDGLAAFLQAFVGLVLLGFYSSVLLGFDAVIIGFVFVILPALGWGGLRTSIKESYQKYAVAGWLEELARCHTSLKINGMVSYLVERTDRLVVKYIEARRSHFKIVFRQAFGNHLFQAIASAGTLAVGGRLVIAGELTLGQLVAAQLIIVTVMASIDKLVKMSSDVYDLLTGLDKVGHVTDLPVERSGGRVLPEREDGAVVNCRSIRFHYRPGKDILTGLDLMIEGGQRVSLVGASGAGKSTLASLMCGLEVPSYGTVEINGVDVREVDLQSLRSIVTIVGDRNEVFEGTIEENIMVGRPSVSHEDVRWALEVVRMSDDVADMSNGVGTMLVSGGLNLSKGQLQRLLIARAIVDHPRLLILDEAFAGIDERTKLAILDEIYSPKNQWTIIDISHDAEVVVRSQIIHVLCSGKIVESGSASELSHSGDREANEFSKLFPDLARRLVNDEV